jgi:hypothetical protein
MIRITCFTVITLFFLLTGSLQSPAQDKKFTAAGTVLDAVTQQPMANVNISIVGSAGGGATDQTGKFTLSLARIPSILYFSHVGYSIGSYQVEKTGERNIRILLEPETKEIEEVTIRAERISKVIKGDTLQIIDYEIDGNRIILFASSHHDDKDQRIYLADLNGDTLSHLNVKGAGKQIKFPEIIMPQTDYLIKDFTGQVQFLDKCCAHEIKHTSDKLSFGYDTPYSDFIRRVLPIKCEIEGNLVFQISTMTENFTWYYSREVVNGVPIKYVQDKKGPGRYASEGLRAYAPHFLDVNKNVSVPLFKKDNELFVFDFFGNNFEVFNSYLNPVRKVPIHFQNTKVKEGLIFRYSYVDVDVYNFTQTILFDEKAGKAYAFFRVRSNNKQSLKEVNLETGKIDRVIEIPDYPNISNVRVHDNVVYFLYDTKVYPFCRNLFRMTI